MSNIDDGVGGYRSSEVFSSSEVRVASSTFDNYVGGTIGLICHIALVFAIISGLALLLMCYTRRAVRLGANNGGANFYAPPPRILRQSKTSEYFDTLRSGQNSATATSDIL